MTIRRPELYAKLLICALAASIVLFLGACRRNANRNSNANAGSSSVANPEQAKQQAQSLVDQGKELYKNDQDDQALATFKRAIVLDPNNADAQLWLGRAYGALEQKVDADESYKKAIDLYKKRVQKDSNDADAFFNLGEAYSFLHLDEEAARNYRQATRLKPDDEEAWYRLGMAEVKLAQYAEAASAFQKALDLRPDDSRASDGLQDAQEGTQRIKEGKKHAEDMLKQQQANANANGNLNMNSNRIAKPTPKGPPAKP